MMGIVDIMVTMISGDYIAFSSIYTDRTGYKTGIAKPIHKKASQLDWLIGSNAVNESVIGSSVVNSSEIELGRYAGKEKAWHDLELLFAKWDTEADDNSDLDWFNHVRSGWNRRLSRLYGTEE